MDPDSPNASEVARCPSDADLGALATGRIQESKQTELELHLNSCEPCQSRLDRLLGEVVPVNVRRDCTESKDGGGQDTDEALTVPIVDAGRRLPEKIGPYRITQVLGEGGFGIVYQAEQRTPVRRTVALKVLKAGMDSREILARFEAERQALAIMDHPCIAQVLDAGQSEHGRPYFAMELVRGEPITDYCDRQLLSLRERIKLFIPVCRAVQHAHQKGVIHRDIKPSNVMITLVDGKPVPKIIDFGIAKAVSQPLTEQTLHTVQGQMIGTPEYMSPEQAEMTGLDIDTRADIYSLGVLLYELLTGTLPFEKKTLREAGLADIQRVIRETDPPKPSTRLSTLGKEGETFAKCRKVDQQALSKLIRGDLDWITLKCLEKDRTRRYETANDLALELGRYLSHEPVLAGPPSAGYKVKKFVRKHRVGVLATGLVLITLVLGLVGSTVGMLWAIRAEADATTNAELAESRLEQVEQERNRTDAALRDAEWQSYLGNIAAAASALETHMPITEVGRRLEACPEHLRNWEWAWLNAASDDALLVLDGHTGPVTTASFSPDGKRVVTASHDGTTMVWDVHTGDLVTTWRGHTQRINTVVYSPDGNTIMTSSSDGTVRLWEAATGTETASLAGRSEPIHSASFSLNGKRILANSQLGTYVWDTESETVLTFIEGDQRSNCQTTFDPSGNRIATGSSRGQAMLWDVESGEVVTEHIGHDFQINSAAFNPDGDRVVTASRDGTARVWDTQTGDLQSELTGHTSSVSMAAFNGSGTKIVTASDDGTACIWGSDTSDKPIVLGDHPDRVIEAIFSPDDQRVLTRSGRSVWMWDTRTGKQVANLIGHTSSVNDAVFSPDVSLIVTVSDDGTARVWNAEAGGMAPALRGYSRYMKTKFTPDNSNTRTFNPMFASLANFSPDGGLVLVGGSVVGNTNISQVWDVATGRLISALQGPPIPVLAASLNMDGSRIAAVSLGGAPWVWDTQTGQQLVQLEGHADLVFSTRFSPDARRIVTASNDRTARLWDAQTGAVIAVLSGHTGPVNSAVFSPDNKRVVTTSTDMTSRVWDTETGELTTLLQSHAGPINAARVSLEGAQIVTASVDHTAKVWDVETGKLQASLTGHTDSVNAAEFSPDDTHIVTASNDGTARVWDAKTGASSATLAGHSSWVSSASYSPDGSRIITGSGDGSIRVWDAVTYDEVLVLKMSTGQVRSASFNQDGTRIVAVSIDGTPRVWDCRTYRDRVNLETR